MSVILNENTVKSIEEGEVSILIPVNVGRFKGIFAHKTDGIKVGDVILYERFDEGGKNFSPYAIFVGFLERAECE